MITPEGCAAILWKDAVQAPQAAASLKITAPDLLALGLVDQIVPEPEGGAQEDWDRAAEILSEYLQSGLDEAEKLSPSMRLEKRYQKFRAMGSFSGHK